MIVFEKIVWANFLSYGNSELTIDLNSANITLFVGKNGQGKSTILDAICYVLFNKAFRDLNLPKLVNSINGKGLRVGIEFRIGTKQYKVLRGMKPALFEVWEDGVLINQDAKATEYQDKFERNILKMNFKTFVQIVLLGSRSFTPFMRLKASERREVIEDLLDLKYISVMNALHKDRLSTLKEDLQTAENNLYIAKNSYDVEVAYANKRKEDKVATIVELQTKIADARQRVEAERKSVDELMLHVEALETVLPDEAKLLSKRSVMDGMRQRILDRREQVCEAIDFYEHNENCPTCKQSIDSVFKTQKIDEQERKHKELEDGWEKFQQQYQELIEQISLLNESNREIRSMNLKIAVHNTTISNLMDFEQKTLNEINNLQSQNETPVKKEDDVKALAKQIKFWDKRREDLLAEIEVERAVGMVLKDEGYKVQEVKRYVPMMNKLINKYLAALDFPCKFELDETFNETIRSRNRDNFVYESFSEGQKLRIDLAIMFAWRAIAKHRNSASTNLLIMDEIFDGPADEDGLENILGCIKKLSKESNTIVISPKGANMSDNFDAVYRFNIVKNFSRKLKEK